jgi:hypothetical protein
MPSAIEIFKEQRDAADRVHQRLVEVSRLLSQLNSQANTLATDNDLRAVLREEQEWLAEAQCLVAEIRHFRQSEDHRWLAVLRRWVFALLFALASAGVAGAGYAAVVQNDGEAVASLRERAAFADAIQKRLEAMTPLELRQFDRLLRGNPAGR